MGLSHLRQLTHPLSLIFLICKMGIRPQGTPWGFTQDLPPRHTSWDFRVWVCLFQLLEWTAAQSRFITLHHITGPHAVTAQTRVAAASELRTHGGNRSRVASSGLGLPGLAGELLCTLRDLTLRQRQLLPLWPVQHSSSWTMAPAGSSWTPSKGTVPQWYTRSIC